MLVALVWVFRALINPIGMSRLAWNHLIRAIYPVVKQYRDEATTLAREFYDANRARETGAPRQDVFKDDYYPIEWFAETLEPTYQQFQRTRNVDGAITDLSARVTKVVEDGARRTLIEAVEEDVDQPIRGWARYDPQPPTCAFCTMMISRGPVYQNAGTAGLRLDEDEAERLANAISRNQGEEAQVAEEEMRQMMTRWHPGCTCLVVPVYKLSGYQTEAQEDAAFEIYKRARARATEKTFKGILKEMRRELYKPAEEQDETNLPSVA
jgi:hypothetical protein